MEINQIAPTKVLINVIDKDFLNYRSRTLF